MKYWVFNEEQLEQALRAFTAERYAKQADLSYPAADTVRAFLLSAIAIQHGLRGDVSASSTEATS